MKMDSIYPVLLPFRFTIANMIERLDVSGELFASVLDDPQDLLLALKVGEKFLGGRQG
jgi:hypothetical protein